jgi:hypothetical protein
MIDRNFSVKANVNNKLGYSMSPATKKVAIFYGIWVLFCVLWAISGYGDSKAAHLYLAFTGLPLALLSFQIIPNGAPLATFVAGVIGWVQWCLVAEANSRWDAWRKSKNDKT